MVSIRKKYQSPKNENGWFLYVENTKTENGCFSYVENNQNEKGWFPFVSNTKNDNTNFPFRNMKYGYGWFIYVQTPKTKI